MTLSQGCATSSFPVAPRAVRCGARRYRLGSAAGNLCLNVYEPHAAKTEELQVFLCSLVPPGVFPNEVFTFEANGTLSSEHGGCVSSGTVATPPTSRIVLDEPCWRHLVARSGCRDQAGTCNPLPRRFEAVPHAPGPGRWFLNDTAKTVQYTPLPGEAMSPAAAFVVVDPRYAALVDGASLPGLRNVSFRGMGFAHGGVFDPIATPMGFVDVQAAYYQYGPPAPKSPYWGYDLAPIPAAVRFVGATRVTFANCTFSRIGSNALSFGVGSQDCGVSTTVFADVSGSAVRVGGIHNEMEADAGKQTANVSVVDCTITNAAAEFQCAPAVTIGYARDVSVLHNLIKDVAYSGVSLSWGWGKASYARDNEVAYNEINGAMCGEMVDGGSIYTLGPQPGSSLHHNYLHSQCNLYGVLYNDGGSGWFHTFENVVANSSSAVWILMNPSNPSAGQTYQPPNRAYNNYVDVASSTRPPMVLCTPVGRVNCTIVNTTTVPNAGPWPSAAADTIRASGPRS